MIANISFTTDQMHEMSVRCRTEHEADMFAERLEKRLSVPVLMHLSEEKEHEEMHGNKIQREMAGGISTMQADEEGSAVQCKEMLSVPVVACGHHKRPEEKVSEYAYDVEIDVIDDMTVEDCYDNWEELYQLLPENIEGVELNEVFRMAVKVPEENRYQFRVCWWDHEEDEIIYQGNLEDFLFLYRREFSIYRQVGS